MLTLWIDLVLAGAATAAIAWALALRGRERRLLARLAAQERRGHFLAESPDIRQILRHAFSAAAEVLPVVGFMLYRVGEDGRVEDVWCVEPQPGETEPEPRRDSANPHLNQRVDSTRLLELTATETERSFAPRDLLAGGPNTRHLRLPLYSGDRLIAHLVLESKEPIDDPRKGEIRALLPPLTSSLHALRNWTIAVTDELTGLSSRRYFETRLTEEWARQARYGGALAIACFDLDRFKNLNDSLGHAAGDLVLRRLGEIVRDTVRSSDVACRHGGEEFAILFPEADSEAASAVADRIRRTLAKEKFEFDGKPFRMTLSAGVAEASKASDPEKLMHLADKALYAAKEKGRDRVFVWRQRSTRATRRGDDE